MPPFRLLLAGGLVAVLPACSTNLPASDDPALNAQGLVVGGSVAAGSSGAGNYLAGRFAQSRHDLPAAALYLQQALAADPENVELLQRTYLSLAADGKLDQAATIAKQLLTYDDEAAIAAILVAEQAARDGDWKGAEAAVSRLPKRGLNSFMTPLIVAWSRVGQGKMDSALDALSALDQNPSYATLKAFHAALINDLADRRPAADQAYRAVLAGNGGLTLRTVEAMGAFYRRIGQPAQAAEVVARYAQEHPDSTILDRSSNSRRPVDTAEAGMAEVMFGAAGSLRQGNAPDLALVFGRMAIDLRPDFPLAQVMVADLLQSLGQVVAANEVFLAVRPGNSVYHTAQLRVAANLDDMGDVDGAVRVLEALATQPDDRTDALVTLGDVLRRHKRWDEAVGAYDRAIAGFQTPEREQWAVYYARGVALERAHQWSRAEADFLKALEFEPNEPHVLNYLGYSWIEHGTNLAEARKMIEKAVEQRPSDGFIVDSLGWALFRAGDYQKAVEALERAAELHPEDATINDHLGDALWQVGRKDEARFQWQRALVFDPEPELKASIEHKLEANQAGLAVPLVPPSGRNAAVR